jgi:hypothetical protein
MRKKAGSIVFLRFGLPALKTIPALTTVLDARVTAREATPTDTSQPGRLSSAIDRVMASTSVSPASTIDAISGHIELVSVARNAAAQPKSARSGNVLLARGGRRRRSQAA